MGRRAETRERLQSVALELFARHGYDAVTVDRVAAAAGVTAMTFFRHFPTKDAVVLDDPYDPVIGELVGAQPPRLPPLERVRRALAEAWSQLPEPDRDDTRRRVRIVCDHPALTARMWQNNLTTQRVIVSALTSTGVPRLQAEVAAGACLGAITAALLDWGRREDGSLGDAVHAALDQLAVVGGPPAAAT